MEDILDLVYDALFEKTAAAMRVKPYLLEHALRAVMRSNLSKQEAESVNKEANNRCRLALMGCRRMGEGCKSDITSLEIATSS